MQAHDGSESPAGCKGVAQCCQIWQPWGSEGLRAGSQLLADCTLRYAMPFQSFAVLLQSREHFWTAWRCGTHLLVTVPMRPGDSAYIYCAHSYALV